MPSPVPAATQGVTVYSFSVAKCELKGCGTVSAVGQEPAELPKTHTVGRIQENIQGEEQEKVCQSLGCILGRMEVKLEGCKSFCGGISTTKLIIL